MNTIPYEFQVKGARLIRKYGGRALLSDDMGLGKSLTTLLYLQRNANVRPVVIVCPASMKWGWQRELQTHMNWHGEVLEGLSADRDWIYRPEFLIVNYDILAPRDGSSGWVDKLRSIKPKCVVLDECHAIQNRSAKRTKAVKELCRGVPHVLALSGTPMTNKPAELYPVLNILRPDVFSNWHSYAWDHCLPKDAPVLISDFTEKPIGEIQIGDEVVGWGYTHPNGQRRLKRAKVLNVICKLATLQKVYLSNGDVVVCTPDHKWATGHTDGPKLNAFSIAKIKHKSGIGRWAASSFMKVLNGTTPRYSTTAAYKLGYIHGFFRGDGHCVRNRLEKDHPFKNTTKICGYKHSIGVACADIEPIQRLKAYLQEFSFSKDISQRSDGLYQLGKLCNKDVYKFLTVTSSETDTDEWWAGFLGGIYDAEGCGRTIAQCWKINPVTHEMICRGLQRFKFDISISKNKKTIRMLGNRNVLLRFWDIADPVLRRKLTSLVYANGGKFNHGGVFDKKEKITVTKIEPLPGLHATYTLTTETGNYVAYGYGSKNCGPKRKPWGMEYKGATNLKELNEKLQGIMIRRLKQDVLTQLPSKSTHILPLPLSDRKQYQQATNEFLIWLAQHRPDKLTSAARAERLAKVNYLKQLSGELKLPAIMEWIDNFLETGAKLVVFACYRKTLAQLRKRYSRVCTVIEGETSTNARKQAVEDFQNKPACRLFLGNIRAAGSGLTLTRSSTVLFTELDWTPGAHAQASDRVNRIGQTEPCSIYYSVGVGTIEEKLIKLLIKKQNVLDATLDGGVSESTQVFEELISELYGECK